MMEVINIHPELINCILEILLLISEDVKSVNQTNFNYTQNNLPVGRKGYFHHSRRDPQHAGRRAVTPAHRPDWYRNRRELPFRGRDHDRNSRDQPLLAGMRNNGMQAANMPTP